MTRICSCGRPMRITDRFLFDHEETDSPSDTESLALFGLMGIELGARVTVWGCPVCDHTMADFDYSDKVLADGE